jgi:hypothetical protein
MNLSHAVPPRASRSLAAFHLIAVALVSLAVAAAAPRAVAQSQSGFQYNGMDYIDYTQDNFQNSSEASQTIRETGANYTAVMATWYVQTYDATTIAPETTSSPGYNSSTDPLSPSDAAVIAAIRALQDQGLTVTLKPHVDSIDDTWRGDFTWPAADTTTAEQQAWLTAWFTSYQAFILHFAQIASENGVGTMVIGTEFTKLTGSTCAGSCEAYWLQYVINPLRQQYPNLTLAYGANATSAGDEFTTVSFWKDVDIIGVDGYFPIDNASDCNTSTPPDPTVAELVSGWTNNPCSGGFNAEAALQNLSQSYPGKPLIFTEIGYPSATGSNAAPYNYTPTGAYDEAEQANCYEAFFEVFSQQASWMKGVFWWDWSVSAPGANDTGYSPQNKTAGDATLPEWYGSQTEGFTLAPANSTLTLDQGSNATTVVSITPLDGFNGTVTLAASGLPNGVTATLAAGSVTNTQILTLAASGTAAAGGPVTVTITGTSGSMTATTTIALTVAVTPPGFTLLASPASVSVGQGSSSTSTITVNDTGGFTGAVTLAASGLPSGVSATFGAGSVAGTQILVVSADSSATTGNATVTITGTGTSGAQTLTASTTIALTVGPPPSFVLAAGLSTLTVAQGSSNMDTITVTGADGFTGSVTLSVSDLPTGVTASFDTNPTTGSSNLTLTASSSAALGGPFTVTITGTSGGQTDSTTLQLTVVVPPSFTLLAQNPTLSISLGTSATDPIQITQLGGFTGVVQFTVTGLPSGVSASFSPNPASGASTTMTVTAAATAEIEGPVSVTVTGTSGKIFEEATVALTVAGVPGFAASGSGTQSISFEPGATEGNSVNIAVIGTNGFSGTVNLVCAIAANSAGNPPTCTLSPASVTISGNTAESSLLTIDTSAPGSARAEPYKLFWPSAGGTALALVLLVGVPRRRRNWLALLVFLSAFAATSLVGCGSNGKGGGGGGPGTTPGSYVVTVTGTSGSTNATLDTVNVTIQ